MLEIETVTLREEDDYFVAEGNAHLIFGKKDAPMLVGRPFPAMGAISQKNVSGFRIDEAKDPPLMYLDWRYSDGQEAHILVGKIENLEKAREWVAKVNILYQK